MAGNDFAKFAVKVGGFAANLQADMDKASLKTAQRVTAVAKTSIRIGAGGDSKMSGLGSRKTRASAGAEVTARYEVDQQGGRGRATTYLVKGTKGLWLLDNPTRPHPYKKAKKVRASKADRYGVVKQKSKSALAKQQSFYESMFGGAQHPGTRGKRTFWNAIDWVSPQVPRISQAELVKAMSRHLK